MIPGPRQRHAVQAVALASLGVVGCARVYHGEEPPRFVAEPALPEEASAPSEPRVALPGAEPRAETETDVEAAPIPLDLAQVVRACVLGDPRIRAALESLEQSRADFVTSSLPPNPSLLVSQTLTPYPGNHWNATTRQGGPPQLDVGLGYSLDELLFGKRRTAMEAARRGVDVALAAYADVARTRILEAITAYFDVLESRGLAELAREEVAQLERIRAITEQRQAIGGVGEIEVDRVRLAVTAGRRRLIRAEAEADNARARLRARLGRAVGAERAEASGSLESESPPAPPELEDAIRVAVEHRPDIAAATRQVGRSRADLTRERRAALPGLNVTAGYTRQFQERAIGFPDANSWSAALSMSLPIFDRNQGNIRGAASAVRQATFLLDAALIELRAELEQAVRSYRSAYEEVTTLDGQALEAASTARQRVEEAYALGGRTLLEVLDAQAAYREVFRDHINARAALLRALHRLNAATGTEMLR